MLVKDPAQRITLPEIKVRNISCFPHFGGIFKTLCVAGSPLGDVPRRVPPRLRGGELRRARRGYRHRGEFKIEDTIAFHIITSDFSVIGCVTDFAPLNLQLESHVLTCVDMESRNSNHLIH